MGREKLQLVSKVFLSNSCLESESLGVFLLVSLNALAYVVQERKIAKKINTMFCFFSSGKQKCAHDASHILRVLSDLLGHENQEVVLVKISIKNSINFALYTPYKISYTKSSVQKLRV